MKIYINKYREHWISPYTILEHVVWWRDWDDYWENNNPERWRWVEPAVAVLHGPCVALQRILNIVRPRIEYVKIDPWDTWNMDVTLAQIVLPMLRQLRASKQGSPSVDDEDVPEHLRSTAAAPKNDPYDIDDLWHARWAWFLDEMIWSFEQLTTDWESQYHSGESDYQHVPIEWDEQGHTTRFELKHGPRHTATFDRAGYEAHNDRIDRGLRLFGRYYRGLWD